MFRSFVWKVPTTWRASGQCLRQPSPARSPSHSFRRPRLTDMPRYKLTIEYDGGPFVGWQMQDAGLSVQGVLAAAIEAFCGERVSVNGAGRTDAGVHALGQVGHVDLSRDWDTDTVRDAVTAQLRPHPVAVLAARTGAGHVRRALLRVEAALPLSHRQPPLRSDARCAAAPGGCRARSTHARHARRRATPGRASTTSPPFALPSARPSRR